MLGDGPALDRLERGQEGRLPSAEPPKRPYRAGDYRVNQVGPPAKSLAGCKPPPPYESPGSSNTEEDFIFVEKPKDGEDNGGEGSPERVSTANPTSPGAIVTSFSSPSFPSFIPWLVQGIFGSTNPTPTVPAQP